MAYWYLLLLPLAVWLADVFDVWIKVWRWQTWLIQEIQATLQWCACLSALAHAVLPVSCTAKPQPCLLLLSPEGTLRNHLALEGKRVCDTQNQLEDTFIFCSQSAGVKELDSLFKKKKEKQPKTKTKRRHHKTKANQTNKTKKKQMANKSLRTWYHCYLFTSIFIAILQK